MCSYNDITKLYTSRQPSLLPGANGSAVTPTVAAERVRLFAVVLLQNILTQILPEDTIAPTKTCSPRMPADKPTRSARDSAHFTVDIHRHSKSPMNSICATLSSC